MSHTWFRDGWKVLSKKTIGLRNIYIHHMLVGFYYLPVIHWFMFFSRTPDIPESSMSSICVKNQQDWSHIVFFRCLVQDADPFRRGRSDTRSYWEYMVSFQCAGGWTKTLKIFFGSELMITKRAGPTKIKLWYQGEHFISHLYNEFSPFLGVRTYNEMKSKIYFRPFIYV